jgi:prophage regulatory protein
LRRPQVLAFTGLKRTALDDEIKRGNFPRPIRVGVRAVGWIEDEVATWQRQRIAQRDGGEQ